MEIPVFLPLPKGITGFSNAGEPFVGSLDNKFVKSLAFSIDYSQHYKLFDFKMPQISANYFRLTIEDGRTNDVFSILINAHYPFYAAVTKESQWMNLVFIEAPTAIQNLFAPHFQYLSPKDLGQIVQPEQLILLGESELQQITSWKSERIGDIVFNGYD